MFAGINIIHSHFGQRKIPPHGQKTPVNVDPEKKNQFRLDVTNEI